MRSFVERLDAIDLATAAGFELPPVVIYGDDVTHVITEQGVANLLLCRSPREREGALRAIAGDTNFGRAQARDMTDNLRESQIVMRPSDLAIDAKDATRDLLSAPGQLTISLSGPAACMCRHSNSAQCRSGLDHLSKGG
jgi:malonate decarboxylase alpha subunit